MKLLDRLPIYREPSVIAAQRDAIQVWRNQIIIWVSIGDVLRPFPAILDTGHSHNLAISRRHFVRWCGAEPKQTGESKVGTEIIPQFKVDVRLHKNLPGRHDLTGSTYSLEMDQGISIIPDELRAAPRLPLLGMRSIVNNNLTLLIDGKHRQVTLKTRGWF